MVFVYILVLEMKYVIESIEKMYSYIFKNVSKCISKYLMYMNVSIFPNAPQGRYIDKFKVLNYLSM